MTLEKAIEELEHPDWLGDASHTPKYGEAILLGIEALKEIKHARTISVGLIPEKLPGETEE